MNNGSFNARFRCRQKVWSWFRSSSWREKGDFDKGAPNKGRIKCFFYGKWITQPTQNLSFLFYLFVFVFNYKDLSIQSQKIQWHPVEKFRGVKVLNSFSEFSFYITRKISFVWHSFDCHLTKFTRLNFRLQPRSVAEPKECGKTKTTKKEISR